MNTCSRTTIRAQRMVACILALIVGTAFLVACGDSSNKVSDQPSAAAMITAKVTDSSSGTVGATVRDASTPESTATGVSTPVPTQISSSSATASTPVSSKGQAEASCRSAELYLNVGNRFSEPTGQHTLSLTLTNRSTRPCSLLGYPTAALFDAAGGELPFDYQQHGDQVVTSTAPRRVDISPGSMAFVTLNKYRCDLGDRAVASRVQLLLPTDATPLQATLSPLVSAMSFGYCGPGDPGSIVSISPIAVTLSETITH